MRTLSNPAAGLLRALMLGVAGVFFALHFVHLTADFPNFSPWMDWSKYTDEGWYGDAAIRHYQLGHWYVGGDFNPAIALPVWPLLEGVLFRFTGVSLVAARALTVAVFGGILLAAYLLIRRWTAVAEKQSSLAAETSVLLLAVSPFLFVFTRLAILEPTLVLLTMLALLAAGRMRVGADEVGAWTTRLQQDLRVNVRPVLALGVLLPAIVLTKTTGLFLVPSIAYLLLAALRYRVWTFLRVGSAAAGLGALLWLAYFVLVVRPRYLLDYRYLFSANAYTGITLATAGKVLVDTVMDGMWIGPVLYGVALGCVALALVCFGRLREHPLVPALLLWALGYAAFLAYHDNLQPRYYLVVAVPLTLLVPVTLEQVGLGLLASPGRRRIGLALAAVLIAWITAREARETLHYVRHPEYTLVRAAEGVREVIAAERAADPTRSVLVLSISGSDLSLMTGLPSICDDFGTLELVDRVKRYRPGWYVAWNEIDDDKMDALTPFYHLERVAAFPAMDAPERNLLIVYRLDSTVVTKPNPRHRKPPPKRLTTKVGQQPSTNQLEH